MSVSVAVSPNSPFDSRPIAPPARFFRQAARIFLPCAARLADDQLPDDASLLDFLLARCAAHLRFAASAIFLRASGLMFRFTIRESSNELVLMARVH